MRSSICLAAGLLAFSPGVAFAQATDTDSGEVAVNGRVAAICVIGEPSQATIDLGQLIALSGTRVGRIGAVGQQSVTLPNSFCNFAGSVATIQASALVETSATIAAVSPGFARAINYAASAGEWGGGSATTSTVAAADGSSAISSGTSSVQPLPRLTDIVVSLDGWSVPSDALLVAGDYGGLVRITLGPAAVTD